MAIVNRRSQRSLRNRSGETIMTQRHPFDTAPFDAARGRRSWQKPQRFTGIDFYRQVAKSAKVTRASTGLRSSLNHHDATLRLSSGQAGTTYEGGRTGTSFSEKLHCELGMMGRWMNFRHHQRTRGLRDFCGLPWALWLCPRSSRWVFMARRALLVSF